MITHKDDEQDYDEAGMIAQIEHDFEILVQTITTEKDNEIDLWKSEAEKYKQISSIYWNWRPQRNF